MDVLEEHAGLIGRQLHIGKVPEAADAQGDKPVSQRLGHVLGYGEHCHVGVVVGDIFLQLVHGADSDAADLRAHKGGRDVKGGVDAEPYLIKIKVLQQRVAQVAGADDDDLVAAVDAQNVADLGAQLRHVVTVALLTEFAEAAEILADLGGGDVHLCAQRVGGDADNTLVIQVVQIAVIAGKPVDHRVGDLLFLHTKTFFWDRMRCGGT